MANTYLTKTFSSGGNQRIWTLSFWVKLNRGTGDDSYILTYAQSSGSNPRGEITFRNDANGNNFRVGFNPTGSSWTNCDVDNRKFRDYSAWYHVVVAVDTTQSTASNRVKVYINGEQQTVSTQPSQNFDTGFNHTHQQSYGRYENSDSSYLDGLLSHIHFIDGTQYQASTFGETDSTSGIWKPKTAPSVTYGTNGYFLKFENSGAMGTDSSGNSNTFTVSGNLTQNVDTPSNNFATMNPLDVSGNPAPPTFANGNLSVDSVATSQNATARSTLAVSAGKWYVEAKQVGTASPEFMRIGILGADSTTYVSTNQSVSGHATGYAYKSTGVKGNNQSESSYGNSYTNGDIIGIAFDADNGTIWFSKNGTWQNSATITEIQNGTTTNSAFSSISMTRYFMFASSMAGATSGLKYEWNFGSGFFGTTAVASANADANGHGAMEYAVPSGYYTLNTKNIKEFG